MSWLQNSLLSMGLALVKMALPMLTDGMNKLLREMLDKLDAYAKQTEPNFDDVLVAFLRGVLGIPGEEVEPTPVPTTSISGTFIPDAGCVTP